MGKRGPKAKDAALRFRSLVDTSAGVDACWPWKGHKNRAGYGSFALTRTKKTGAHRFALSLKLGRPLAAGENACHSCDHPWCVNPKHLFPGTQKDNLDDAYAKGRIKKGKSHWSSRLGGERNGRAKLSAKQVQEIRSRFAAGETQSSIGKKFGVHQAQVSVIVRFKQWTDQ